MRDRNILISIIWFFASTANAQSVTDYWNKGTDNLMVHKCEEAIGFFDKALVIDPKDRSSLFNRASAKSCTGDLVGAIADYTKIINNNPFESKVLLCRGRIKMNLKDHRGAIIDFTKAIEQNFPAHYDRGVAKYHLKDYVGAMSDFEKCQYISSDNYYYQGLCKIKLGKVEEGCIALSKAGEAGNAEAYEMIKEHCQ